MPRTSTGVVVRGKGGSWILLQLYYFYHTAEKQDLLGGMCSNPLSPISPQRGFRTGQDGPDFSPAPCRQRRDKLLPILIPNFHFSYPFEMSADNAPIHMGRKPADEQSCLHYTILAKLSNKPLIPLYQGNPHPFPSP